MPVTEDPGRAGGRVLHDAGGAEIGRFLAADHDGTPFADLFTLADGVEPEAAVPVVLAELAGWRVGGEPALGRALIRAGARHRRHAHVMSRDLVRDPAPSAWLEPSLPAGLRLTPADRPALDLAPACFAAYPPEHPDYPQIPTPERPEVELEEILSGRLLGPLLAPSGLAVAGDGAVVGGLLVTASPGEPPFGGPWVVQLFRAPDAPGAGTALLRRALAIATRDGLPAVGLAVTDGNPARRLYDKHGFAGLLETISVELQARVP